jgi:hypothetical protein
MVMLRSLRILHRDAHRSHVFIYGLNVMSVEQINTSTGTLQYLHTTSKARLTLLTGPRMFFFRHPVRSARSRPDRGLRDRISAPRLVELHVAQDEYGSGQALDHHLIEASCYLGGNDVPGAAFDQAGRVEADERVGDRELALVLFRAERAVDLQFGHPSPALACADQHAFEDCVLGFLEGAEVRALGEFEEAHGGVRGCRKVVPAVDEPGGAQPLDACGDVSGGAYHAGDLGR